MTSKTVCIIGGSFDPIHMGHLQMARSSQAHCLADEVWFMPAGNPWQKADSLIGSTQERAKLVELAISGVHSWRVETLEINKSGPTYTVESLEALAEKHPDYAFTFVIGTDQLANLTSWKYWNSLFDYVRIGVVERAGSKGFKVPEALKAHLMRDRLFRIPMPEFHVSSTDIREQFDLLADPGVEKSEQAKTRLEKWLPAPVWKYLQSHPIYGRSSS